MVGRTMWPDDVGDRAPRSRSVAVDRAVADRVDTCVADGVVEVDARLLEQDRQPERRHRQEQEAEERDRVVDPGVLLHRAEHADDDGEHQREQHRERDQPQRDEEAAGQLGADVVVATGPTGRSHRGQHPAEPEPVAREQRLVEAQPLRSRAAMRPAAAAGCGSSSGSTAGCRTDDAEHEDDERRRSAGSGSRPRSGARRRRAWDLPAGRDGGGRGVTGRGRLPLRGRPLQDVTAPGGRSAGARRPHSSTLYVGPSSEELLRTFATSSLHRDERRLLVQRQHVGVLGHDPAGLVELVGAPRRVGRRTPPG